MLFDLSFHLIPRLDLNIAFVGMSRISSGYQLALRLNVGPSICLTTDKTKPDPINAYYYMDSDAPADQIELEHVRGDIL